MQQSSLLPFFSRPWHEVPTVWIDTETTGVRPGVDRAVQIGFARFEHGIRIASAAWLVNPGIPIPPEATAIHGITDAMVIVHRFSLDEAKRWSVDRVPELAFERWREGFDAPASIPMLDPEVLKRRLVAWADEHGGEYDIDGAMQDGVDAVLVDALRESQGRAGR